MSVWSTALGLPTKTHKLASQLLFKRSFQYKSCTSVCCVVHAALRAGRGSLPVWLSPTSPGESYFYYVTVSCVCPPVCSNIQG